MGQSQIQFLLKGGDDFGLYSVAQVSAHRSNESSSTLPLDNILHFNQLLHHSKKVVDLSLLVNLLEFARI